MLVRQIATKLGVKRVTQWDRLCHIPGWVTLVHFNCGECQTHHGFLVKWDWC